MRIWTRFEGGVGRGSSGGIVYQLARGGVRENETQTWKSINAIRVGGFAATCFGKSKLLSRGGA